MCCASSISTRSLNNPFSGHFEMWLELVLPFTSCLGFLPGIALQTGTKPVPCSRMCPARLLVVRPPANAVDQNARAMSKSKLVRIFNQKLRIGFGASISPLISKLCWMSRLATIVAAVYNQRESTSTSLTLNTISCSLSSNHVSCPVDRYA
jgi:hypothetical protein